MTFNTNNNNILSPKATGKAKHTNDLAIVERIVTQFKDSSRKDIQKWRTAIQVAESPEKPRRDLLMDIYEDILTDAHLYSQMELRKSATLNTPFQVINGKSGEVDRHKTALLNSKWFYDFLGYALDSKFYGHSLVEFISFDGNKIKNSLIPRRNVVPNTKQVVLDWNKSDVRINYADPKFEDWVLPIGKDNDLGVLNKIVPNLIWKRNVMQTWAEFCERFGIPLITATTVKQDTDSLDLIDSMLTQLGEAAHAVFPEGTTVEIKDANRTDAYMIFDKKIKRNNDEISKAITGGTMLSSGENAGSQSQVHERNLVERLGSADKRFLTFITNDYLLPLLAKKGYDFTPNDKFVFNLSTELGLSTHFDIVKDMMDEGLEIEQSWLSKTFNVPITGKRVIPGQNQNSINSKQQKDDIEALLPESKQLFKNGISYISKKNIT